MHLLLVKISSCPTRRHTLKANCDKVYPYLPRLFRPRPIWIEPSGKKNGPSMRRVVVPHKLRERGLLE